MRKLLPILAALAVALAPVVVHAQEMAWFSSSPGTSPALASPSVTTKLTLLDDVQLQFGTAGTAAASTFIEYDTGETNDAVKVGISTTSRALHFMDAGDFAQNRALSAFSNPTLVIWSNTDASTTQYMSLSHSTTGGAISTGVGTVTVTPGSGGIALTTAADTDITVGGGGAVNWRSTSTRIRENSGLEVVGGTSKGVWVNTARFQTEYASVASANDLTLTTANVFDITGTTTINAITTTNWDAGACVVLIFASTPTVKNNTAGGASTAVMRLAGGVDFSATANDALSLCYNGTAWIEKGRSVN